MTTLLLKLFGSPQILLGDDPLVVRPRNSIKARAILYYLAVLGEPVTLHRLAGAAIVVAAIAAGALLPERPYSS